MADTMRPMSILPSIKCSSCGMEIEISKMGDHVCSTSAPPAAQQEQPEVSKPSPQSFFDRAATGLAPKPSGLLKPGRTAPPPKIDSKAANRPFLSVDQLTPMSNYSKSPSPLTPSSGRRSPQPGRLPRSATSPAPRLYSPPSPDLPISQDCAFPPFPVARSATFTEPTSKPKRAPEPNPRHLYAEADPLLAPLSPRTNGGSNVLRRMDNIAPGPFTERKGSFDRTGHKRTATALSNGSNGGNVNAQRPSTATTTSSGKSRSSIQSNGTSGLPPKPKIDTEFKTKPGPPPRPARPEKVDNFLEQMQEQSGLSPVDRSPVEPTLDTRLPAFPGRKEDGNSIPMQRRPSEPAIDKRRPSNVSESYRPLGMRTFSGSPERPGTAAGGMRSRSASRSGSRAMQENYDIPPIPKPLSFKKEIPITSLHAPSDSGSSEASLSGSDMKSISSRSTAPSSDASGLSRRPSKDETLGPTSVPDALRFLTGAPQGFNRGNGPEPLKPPGRTPIAEAPESPMDPAIQRGLFNRQRRPSQANGPPSSESPLMPPLPPILRAGSPSGERATGPPVNRRATAPNKGKCRGCGEVIVGKSVKAADGRLTGRWHKQCFVCKTCRAPFQTADFYVLNNHPYCERHYHELNGSLCKSCDHGIEGQYLETDRRQKFHPRCFTCMQCRMPLRDDYFEVDQKVFCERHAFAAARQNNYLGGVRRNPERRTTRLMMM